MNNDITPCKHGRIDCDECHDKYRGIRGSICPVFGCTIPRGIPHEHPAGVSAVMRDPGAPLTDIERAELQYHRQQAAERNNQMIEAYHADPMTGGPKLRDALMMAGTSSTVRSTATVEGVQVVTETTYGPAPRNLDLRNDWLSTVITDDWERPKCPPLVRTVGRFMAWIFGAIGVASILILSAMTAGWL